MPPGDIATLAQKYYNSRAKEKLSRENTTLVQKIHCSHTHLQASLTRVELPLASVRDPIGRGLTYDVSTFLLISFHFVIAS